MHDRQLDDIYDNMKKFFISALVLLLLPNISNAVSEKGYESLHIFSKVLSQIENNYVEDVDDSILIRGAIHGLLSTLDPHSTYMPPQAYKELRVDTSGKFGGVGIEVWIRDGLLTVVAPIDGTPASRADIKSGDKVVKIDGHFTRDMDLSDAVLKMRGKVGSKITLTLSRDDNKKTFDVTLTREIIKVPSVRYEILDEEYGYIKLRTFQERTVKDMEAALKKLRSAGALKGLILDLRDNPGGLLDQAVYVSDLFMDKGVIVTTKSRGEEIDRQEAHADGNETTCPMIILTNGGTASASEIVAGALKDHARAVVLGTKTFGKGSVQTVMEMDDGSALKLTIALYFTPSGRSIQAQGIIPDIVVSSLLPETASTNKTPIREEDLPGHLIVPEAETPSGNAPATVESAASKIDYQKKVALDYLKSWEIFRKDE